MLEKIAQFFIVQVVQFLFEQVGNWLTLEYFKIQDKKEIGKVVNQAKTAETREDKFNAAHSIGDLSNKR